MLSSALNRTIGKNVVVVWRNYIPPPPAPMSCLVTVSPTPLPQFFLRSVIYKRPLACSANFVSSGQLSSVTVKWSAFTVLRCLIVPLRIKLPPHHSNVWWMYSRRRITFLQPDTSCTKVSSANQFVMWLLKFTHYPLTLAKIIVAQKRSYKPKWDT